jgi:predicted enzyme related to lactoylglutathione lyase
VFKTISASLLFSILVSIPVGVSVSTSFCSSALAAQVPPAIQYVGAISIETTQAKALIDWYQKFGLVDIHQYDGGYYGSFKTPDPTNSILVGIHSNPAATPEKTTRSISVTLRVNDYSGYVAKLDAEGLKPYQVAADFTGHFAIYKDPDGNEMTIWGQ